MAHELAHVRNRDILIGTIAATTAGAISLLANMAQWAMIFGSGQSDDDDAGGIVGLIAMMIIALTAAILIQTRRRPLALDFSPLLS